MNWRWPAKRGSTYCPWYVIGWRALWVLPYGFAYGLIVTIVCFMHGPAAAITLAKDIR